MNYKSIRPTALLFLLCAVSVFAQPDGFLSFRVNGGDIEIVEQSGNVSGITLIHTGAFAISLSDEGSTAYQVAVSNDSCPIIFQESHGNKLQPDSVRTIPRRQSARTNLV